MIQFNLLPDVKKEYVKAKRTKRLITSVSLLVSAASIVVVLLLFSIVQIAQKKHISDLTKDIEAGTTEIQRTENLNKVLSVQNQLSLLPGLHEAKPETSRLFSYISFVSPQPVKVLDLRFSLTDETMDIQGTADSIATVDKFVSNLRAVRYKIEDNSQDAATIPPYSQIATQLNGDSEGASFKISMSFDPVIFENTTEIVMQLESQTMTTKPTEGTQ